MISSSSQYREERILDVIYVILGFRNRMDFSGKHAQKYKNMLNWSNYLRITKYYKPKGIFE